MDVDRLKMLIEQKKELDLRSHELLDEILKLVYAKEAKDAARGQGNKDS